MQTFRDLIIKLNDAPMDEFMGVVAARVGQNKLWRVREDKENDILGTEKIYTFQREKDSRLPGAGLSIFPKGERVWYVPNVVPLEYGWLTHQQYNDILTEFYDLFIHLEAEKMGIHAEISSGVVTDVEILGEESARLLEKFSICANKSTGSCHPCDRERWFAFIKKVCSSEKRVDTDYLKRILQEQGWTEERSTDLAIEFEFARDLIEYLKV